MVPGDHLLNFNYRRAPLTHHLPSQPPELLLQTSGVWLLLLVFFLTRSASPKQRKSFLRRCYRRTCGRCSTGPARTDEVERMESGQAE